MAREHAKKSVVAFLELMKDIDHHLSHLETCTHEGLVEVANRHGFAFESGDLKSVAYELFDTDRSDPLSQWFKSTMQTRTRHHYID